MDMDGDTVPFGAKRWTASTMAKMCSQRVVSVEAGGRASGKRTVQRHRRPDPTSERHPGTCGAANTVTIGGAGSRMCRKVFLRPQPRHRSHRLGWRIE